ncbi:hypothetical protein GLE_5212 [Lysobacter enzymogenes]|uniref:Uncharacterized protein n=1 Tax=Lysobacter enzymogenes TaxID=69 RepID=A0A0S2DQ65_LYSEN|nr:hypothetical protein GLE_5212 [Lysobacter enzymogenes]
MVEGVGHGIGASGFGKPGCPARARARARARAPFSHARAGPAFSSERDPRLRMPTPGSHSELGTVHA